MLSFEVLWKLRRTKSFSIEPEIRARRGRKMAKLGGGGGDVEKVTDWRGRTGGRGSGGKHKVLLLCYHSVWDLSTALGRPDLTSLRITVSFHWWCTVDRLQMGCRHEGATKIKLCTSSCRSHSEKLNNSSDGVWLSQSLSPRFDWILSFLVRLDFQKMLISSIVGLEMMIICAQKELDGSEILPRQKVHLNKSDGQWQCE